MSYLNLKGELAKKRITGSQLAALLGLHQNSVYNKIHGESSFSVDESIQIRDTYFPNLTIEWLFQRDDEPKE